MWKLVLQARHANLIRDILRCQWLLEVVVYRLKLALERQLVVIVRQSLLTKTDLAACEAALLTTSGPWSRRNLALIKVSWTRSGS